MFDVPSKLLLALDIACGTYSQIYVGNRLFFSQSRYLGNLARPLRDSSEAEKATSLKELYDEIDPEAVIRAYESSPSLHKNSLAFSEYVKALIKVGRLSESEFLNTLLRGNYLARIASFLLTVFACDCALLCLTIFCGHSNPVQGINPDQETRHMLELFII